jgi:hypothetical protein
MNTQELPELKIEIRRRWRGGLGIDLSLRKPDNELDDDVPGDFRLTKDDRDELAKLSLAGDHAGYGKTLYSRLIGDREIDKKLSEARKLGPVRVRLEIDGNAADLNSLLWETLTDDDQRLTSGDGLLLSRYVRSRDSRQVRLTSRDDIHTLVVVADPKPSKKLTLATIVSDQLKQAVDALGLKKGDQLPAETKVGDKHEIKRATLANIVKSLRVKPADILYLVCHGFAGPAGPVIYLEDDEGVVCPVFARDFAAELIHLRRPPGLVVLASCDSAAPDPPHGSDEAVPVQPDAVMAIGPMLVARGGVSAAIAMQGRVTQDTAGLFFAKFFGEMHEHGQIDLAMSRARYEVRECSDWWMPTLFMRLRQGRLWFAPGFSSEEAAAVWPDLRTALTHERAAVILGPRILDPLIGSNLELAQSWIKELKAIVPDAALRDTVLTAQYLSVIRSADSVRDALRRSVRQAVLDRFADRLPPRLVDIEPFKAESPGHLWELMATAGEIDWKGNENAVHRVLAGLPFKHYFVATPDPLMEHALKARGLCPTIELFNRRPGEDGDAPEPSSETGKPARGQTDGDVRHLVYLFGALSHPGSFALTENDYFDFLANFVRTRSVTRKGVDRDAERAESNYNVLDSNVMTAIASYSLVFLGFDLDSWAFRVLLRAIALRGRQERLERVQRGDGEESLERPICFAVQLAPDERSTPGGDSREEYLRKYFSSVGISADIRVYWGSATDFVRDFRTKWRDEFHYGDPSDWLKTGNASP